jgi:hypothetical protein
VSNLHVFKLAGKIAFVKPLCQFTAMRKIHFTSLALSLFSIFACFAGLHALANPAVPGFDKGNEFVATRLSGQLTVNCAGNANEGPQYGYFRCEDEILDPLEFGKFMGPQVANADTVKLLAKWEDGTQAEQSQNYDASRGISDGFNLWFKTLLQHPLLNYGKNQIQYTLYQNSNAVLSGEFLATVAIGTPRQCTRTGYFFSQDSNDCTFGSVRFCAEYFYQENYCK